MLKKLSVLVVLALLMINVVGFYPFFKIEQSRIRTEIKRRLKNSVPEKDLHVISVESGSTELTWTREGKEFRYNGNMYDIVRSETRNDSVIYHCVNDVQETQLFVNLDKFMRRQMEEENSGDNSFGKNIFKLLAGIHYLPTDQTHIHRFNDVVLKRSTIILFYPSGFEGEISPPPKSVI